MKGSGRGKEGAMATLEDLGRMAMVDIGEDRPLATNETETTGWGKMALLLAASAAVCGLVVGMKHTTEKDSSR